jgi:hypothetical protein
MQVSFPAQVTPQPPQFATSVCSLTHAVPHTLRPLALQVHVPKLHDAAAGHTWPQAPQLSWSVPSGVHAPVEGHHA